MVRKIDEKKTRRALRRLERARKAADTPEAPDRELSEWEGEFLGSLEERLEKYGSAFNDLTKGDGEEALSARQALKLREIEKKTKGKARKPMSRGTGFKRKAPQTQSRSRDIHEDVEAGDVDPGLPEETPEMRRAAFRVVEDSDRTGN